jgi:hypothetical protein
MDVNVDDLINCSEKTVFNYAENNVNHNNNEHCIVVLSETQCVHELEKTQLLLKERDKEIEHLKKQILQQEEIIQLLKCSIEPNKHL